MANRVGIGVIGTGTLGLRHSQTLAWRTPNAKLIAVADTRPRAAQAAADLAPGIEVVRDYQALLAEPDIAGLVITTPNDTHAQLIQEAASAGKHIFCEKPISLDLESADAALDAVSRNNVKLQVGFQRRFEPAYRAAHDTLLAGDLGEVELVVATTRDPAPPPATYFERSGSFFADTAIHDYDALRYLTGLEVSEVYTVASKFLENDAKSTGALDTAVTTIKLDNGALATITNSRRSNYGYDVRIEIAGSKGKVSLGDHKQSSVETYTAAGATRNFVGSYWELFENAYVAEIQHFVDCIANDREPEAGGADARAALEIAILAERSYLEGRPVSRFEP